MSKNTRKTILYALIYHYILKGVVIYVGQTVLRKGKTAPDVMDRHEEHAKRKDEFGRLIRKHNLLPVVVRRVFVREIPVPRTPEDAAIQRRITALETRDMVKHNTIADPKKFNERKGDCHGNHSDKTRAKMSESAMGNQNNKGHKDTPEVKKKKRDAALLRPPPSKKTRSKMSDSARKRIERDGARPMSEAAKKKIGDANRGRVHTEQSRKNMSEGQLNSDYVKSAETRRKIGDAQIGNTHCLGRKLTDEHKQSIGDALRGREFTEEHCRNITEGKLASDYKHSEKTKRQIAKTLTGTKDSEEVKAKKKAKQQERRLNEAKALVEAHGYEWDDNKKFCPGCKGYLVLDAFWNHPTNGKCPRCISCTKKQREKV